MITVTTTAQTNVTPATALASPGVDNTQATLTTAQGQGTVAAEDFSSALNGQINLAAPSVEAVNVALLTTADMTATIANTLATSTETPVLDTNALVNPTVMSEKDTAILATVTDTLKFISSGMKLGDTLPAGQSIQLPSVNLLPNVNLSGTLTQQTVQSAVNQAVTQTQVTTPADILAKQITPVQIATVSPAQTQETASTALPVLESIIITSEENVSSNTASTQNALQLASALQRENSAATVALQNQSVTQQNVDAKVEAATLIAKQNNFSAAEQSNVNPETLSSVSLQTSAQQVTEQVVGITQDKTLTANLAQATTSPAITLANATNRPTQNQQSVVITQDSTLPVSTQQGILNQPAVAQSTQAVLADAVLVTQQTVHNVSNNAAQNQPIDTSSKVTKAQDVIASSVMNSNENLVILSESTVETPTIVDAQTTESSLVITEEVTPQIPAADPTLVPDTLVAMQTVTQQVVAQDVPVDFIESDQTFDKGSENSSTSEKLTTLTSAKTLLMDAVANRNNSGDAGNGSNSSNTPQNSSLNNDKSLNTSIDSKQNMDAKSFASLLSAEKTDVISVSSADKATPQSVNSVVNKLAQDVKSADVAPLTRPLSHPQWNEDLGERIVWMNSRGISSAEIKMNPENMGPITVRIDMNQDQATIAFTAQNSIVRDALEASLPKLREMLSAQQVNLADVSVSQQSSTNSDSGRSFAQASADMSNGQGNRQNTPEVDAEGNIIASSTTNETVDEFENGQVISTNGTNGLLSIYA